MKIGFLVGMNIVGAMIAPHPIHAQEADLLKRATTVIDATNWVSENWSSPIGYGWVSNKEYLYYDSTHDYDLWKYNLDTKQSRYFSTVNLGGIDPRESKFNPTATAFFDYHVFSTSAYTFIYRLKSGTTEQVSSSDYDPIWWLPDGHRWIKFFRKSKRSSVGVLHDLDRPREHRRLLSTIPELDLAHEVGFTPNGRMWLIPASAGNEPVVIETEFGKRITERHRYRVRFAAGLSLSGFRFSPKADRVLWLLTKDNFTRAVFIQSRPDGTEMREVGSFALGTSGMIEPRLVQWLPDGEKISFFFDKKFWIVPVAPFRSSFTPQNSSQNG